MLRCNAVTSMRAQPVLGIRVRLQRGAQSPDMCWTDTTAAPHDAGSHRDPLLGMPDIRLRLNDAADRLPVLVLLCVVICTPATRGSSVSVWV